MSERATDGVAGFGKPTTASYSVTSSVLASALGGTSIPSVLRNRSRGLASSLISSRRQPCRLFIVADAATLATDARHKGYLWDVFSCSGLWEVIFIYAEAPFRHTLRNVVASLSERVVPILYVANVGAHGTAFDYFDVQGPIRQSAASRSVLPISVVRTRCWKPRPAFDPLR
jgi:hypothetical protein